MHEGEAVRPKTEGAAPRHDAATHDSVTAAPELTPAGLLRLHQTIGNQAVGRLLARRAHSARRLDRLIADDGYSTVHVPDTLDVGGEFRESLKVLLGDHTIKQTSWEAFRKVVWPDGAPSAKEEQTELRDWAAANLGKGKSQEEHDPVPVHLTLRQQFLEETKVYRYDRQASIQYGIPLDERLLLTPKDMREKGDPLADAFNGPEACVVQALESFGVQVPDTNKSSAEAWHAFCRDHQPQIDYRTDSQYIKLYVEILRFQLVSTRLMGWKAIKWDEIGGDGRYLVSTFPNGPPSGSQIGHMIGVEVQGGKPHQVHDKQQVTKPHLGGPNVFARYIFRM
jgi:hypothetical protein